jgi:hypothetical protein
VDTYRASGPGGQKRNKTSSAVRIRHGPSGLSVIAEESRSQHENRERALRRLRQALFLELRDLVVPDPIAFPELDAARDKQGRLKLGRKDPRFWPMVGIALDALESTQGRLRDASQLLRISTANLVAFLGADPKVWQRANQMRLRHGHKPLLS